MTNGLVPLAYWSALIQLHKCYMEIGQKQLVDNTHNFYHVFFDFFQ